MNNKAAKRYRKEIRRGLADPTNQAALFLIAVNREAYIERFKLGLRLIFGVWPKEKK